MRDQERGMRADLRPERNRRKLQVQVQGGVRAEHEHEDLRQLVFDYH